MVSNKIFYDGDCGFCNASVAFILKNRRHNDYLFIPLQSERAKEELRKFNATTENLNTIYLIKNNKLFNKSSAVLQICKDLKFPVNCFSAALFVPKAIRDLAYNWIAKYRLRISKQKCYLPNKEERTMFNY